MNIERTIPLDRILPNPWQPRENEDAEHIKNLAMDIVAHGLLQKPVGRVVDGLYHPITDWTDTADGEWSVQLAFGHSRLAAFKWLRDVQDLSNIPGDWVYMPIILQDLTDEQMFEMALSENLQRRDLTPIEVAKAMARYRDEFGKSSIEIGQLFGLSDSTVRNKMRLVELPAEAQEVIASGQITENGARRLLSLKGNLSDAEVRTIAADMAGKAFDRPDQVDNYIISKLSVSKRTKQLYYPHQEDRKTAGEGMWPLDWVPENPLAIAPTVKQVGQMLPDPEQAKGLKANISQVLDLYMQDRDDEGKRVGDPDVVAAVEHLVRLPVCTKCSHFMRINHSGFCARITCWEHKRDLWKAQELARVSAEMGIQAYDKAIDGEVFEEAIGWSGASKARFTQMMATDKGHLRLRIDDNPNVYMGNRNPFTEHPFILLISVSDESCARMLQAKTRDERREAEEKLRNENYKRTEKLAEQSSEFLEISAGLFGKFLFPVSQPALAVIDRALGQEMITEKEGLSDADRVRAYHYALGKRVLRELKAYYTVRNEGPVAVAKSLAGMATEIGLQLPADWIEQAQRIESGETISAETEKSE